MNFILEIFYSQNFKFLLIGGINTLISLIIGNLLYFFLKFHYTIIATINHVICVFISFCMYRKFVFNTQKTPFLKSFLKANITYAVNLLLNLICMYIAIDLMHLSKNIAFNIVSIILIIVLYFMHKFFTFKI